MSRFPALALALALAPALFVLFFLFYCNCAQYFFVAGVVLASLMVAEAFMKQHVVVSVHVVKLGGCGVPTGRRRCR